MSTSKQRILPPGPKAWFSLRHLLAFRRDGIQFMEQLARNYGDIAQFRIGPLRIILINHPDYIKEVLTTQHTNFTKGRPLEMAKALVGEGLLTSEGDFHKRQSRALQPAFP
ncbi:MAG: cytochrome P450 [Phaeodactylibacter sp.]|nr:cytochrome P450 [Phaeodactylibacter sp.]